MVGWVRGQANSLIMDLSQINSFVECVAAMNLASVDDSAMTGCSFELHDMVPPSSKKI